MSAVCLLYSAFLERPLCQVHSLVLGRCDMYGVSETIEVSTVLRAATAAAAAMSKLIYIFLVSACFVCFVCQEIPEALAYRGRHVQTLQDNILPTRSAP